MVGGSTPILWDYRAMMQGCLDGDPILGLIGFLQRNFEPDWNWRAWGNIYLKGMEESVFSSKCRTFNIRNRFSKGQPRETWNDVIRSEPKEKVSKDLAKGSNA